MPLSSRELWLVLRARDEASRTLRGLSRELLTTGAAAQASSLRAQAAAARARAEQMKITGATREQIAAVLASAKAYDTEARSLMDNARQRQHVANLVSNTGQLMQTAGFAAAAAGGMTLYWLGKTIQATTEYARTVSLTRTQITDFSASLEDVGRIGLRVANKIGVAFEQIQPALYDIFSSTNANLKQAEILLTAFSKAAVAGQVDIQQAGRATTAIMNAYNIPLEKVNDVLDIQFKLVQKGVGSYDEFSKVVGNVIPSATRAGQSFDMVAAMLALMTRNGLSAAMAATSGARALEAMSHPVALARLKDMGINALDASGKFRPLTEVLGELRDKLDKVPPADRVKTLVELFKGAGGTIQARRFLEQVLLRPGELEELIGYLGDMQHATGSFERAYNQMADTVATRTALLNNRWQTFKVIVGTVITPAFSAIIAGVSKILEWFNDLSPATQKIIVYATALGAVLLVIGGTILMVVGTLAIFVAAIMAAGTGIFYVVGIAGGIVTAIMALGAALVYAYLKSEGFRSVVIGLWNDLKLLWNAFQVNVLPTLVQVSNQIASVMIPKMKEAGRIIVDLGQKFVQWIAWTINNIVTPALQFLISWWNQIKPTIEPLFPVLAQVAKWLAIIAAVIVGVLVVAIVGPLVVAIAAGVFAFMTIITIIGRVVSFVRMVWAAMEAFGAWLNGVMWNIIHQIGNAFRDTWNDIKNIVTSGVARVTAVMSSIGAIVTTVRNFFGQLSNAASGGIQNLVSLVGGIGTRIVNAVGNLGGLLVSAGRSVIDGLVSGIQGAIGRVRDVLGTVTNMIPSWKGPRDRDLKLLTPAGKAIMHGLNRGIEMQVPNLKKLLNSVTDMVPNDMAYANTGRVGFGSAAQGAAIPSNTQAINNTFNITTQEIDPTRHAADLGWLLAGRMTGR